MSGAETSYSVFLERESGVHLRNAVYLVLALEASRDTSILFHDEGGDGTLGFEDFLYCRT